MTVASGPMMLSSRHFRGIIPSTVLGNVSWSDDGQCLFITKRGVTILTPHLVSTLPPPPAQIDTTVTLEHPNQTSYRVRRARPPTPPSDDDEGDVDGAGPSTGTRHRMRRPKNGEIPMHVTGFEIERDDRRSHIYGWGDVGDEGSSIIRGQEVTVRQAIWSASGLSDLGGCLLVVMNMLGQVSVYAPRSDAASKQWDEVADLTARTRGLLDPKEGRKGDLSIPGMLKMRATALAWSRAFLHPEMSGIDGSLLVVADRSGRIAFWNCGRKRHFQRLAHPKVCRGWVTSLAWSNWVAEGDQTCVSRLACSTTGGSVVLVNVVRKMQTEPGGGQTWALDVGDPREVIPPDGRAVTCLTWSDSLLICTKPGSVHLWVEGLEDGFEWQGSKFLRLQRVGNWAGANAIGSCIGVQRVSSTRLLLILNTLTHHVICNLLTEPTLAPLADSLKPSLAAREAFLEFAHYRGSVKDRMRMSLGEDRAITAHTLGWQSMVASGDIASFVCEPINFHNLDAATEANRDVNFFMTEWSSATPGGRADKIRELEISLRASYTVLGTAPIAILAPHIMGILASFDPSTSALGVLELCSADGAEVPAAPETSLEGMLWAPAQGKFRLRYVLALWGSKAFPHLASRFNQAAEELREVLSDRIMMSLRSWAGAQSRTPASGSPDARMMRALQADTTDKAMEEDEHCPACGEAIGQGTSDSARCARGHEWCEPSRCSITQKIITILPYRVCTICPAVALLPACCAAPPIPTTSQGEDRDWTRFRDSIDPTRDDWLVQTALEAAICCVICGGRWTRAM